MKEEKLKDKYGCLQMQFNYLNESLKDIKEIKENLYTKQQKLIKDLKRWT